MVWNQAQALYQEQCSELGHKAVRFYCYPHRHRPSNGYSVRSQHLTLAMESQSLLPLETKHSVTSSEWGPPGTSFCSEWNTRAGTSDQGSPGQHARNLIEKQAKKTWHILFSFSAWEGSALSSQKFPLNGQGLNHWALKNNNNTCLESGPLLYSGFLHTLPWLTSWSKPSNCTPQTSIF